VIHSPPRNRGLFWEYLLAESAMTQPCSDQFFVEIIHLYFARNMQSKTSKRKKNKTIKQKINKQRKKAAQYHYSDITHVYGNSHD